MRVRTNKSNVFFINVRFTLPEYIKDFFLCMYIDSYFDLKLCSCHCFGVIVLISQAQN